MTFIFAHRGASRIAPENTMSAFIKAYELKADGIELDVQLTKDRIPVVIHDETLKRTTNGEGWVKDKTLSELQQLSAGSWFSNTFKHDKIPTLEEVLTWIKTTPLQLNIELKNTIETYEGMEKVVLNLVDEMNVSNKIIYSSFNHYSLMNIKKIKPYAHIAPLYATALYQPWKYLKRLGVNSAHPNYRTLAPSIIEGFKENNIKIRTYTVNDPYKTKYFLDQDIEAIITDVPDLALSIKKGEKELKSTFIKKMVSKFKNH